VAVAPASPVIPIRIGQWVSDDTGPLVGVQGYQEFPYWRATVASAPVIAYRMGQWISDETAPLVGIHGYQAFPWTNNEVTLIPVDTGVYIPTFRPRRGR
jgi:hypothetical protein